MILSTISDLKTMRSEHKNLNIAVNWLAKTDLQAISVGSFLIDGADVKASVYEYESKSETESVWEVHKKYIDIQCVLQGQESIDLAPVESLSISKTYDEDKDIAFLEGEPEKKESLAQNEFIVLFPGEAHRAGIHGDRQTKAPVKKLVVKVLV